MYNINQVRFQVDVFIRIQYNINALGKRTVAATSVLHSIERSAVRKD